MSEVVGERKLNLIRLGRLGHTRWAVDVRRRVTMRDYAFLWLAAFVERVYVRASNAAGLVAPGK